MVSGERLTVRYVRRVSADTLSVWIIYADAGLQGTDAQTERAQKWHTIYSMHATVLANQPVAL